MVRFVALMIGLVALTNTAEAGKRNKNDALVRVESTHDFDTTLKRLEDALAERKLMVFAMMDHAEAAHRSALDLPPTTVVIFGNPDVGTKLMQSNTSMGLDLPLKMLVTEAKPGEVSVVYRPIATLAATHGIEDRAPVVEKVTEVLATIASEATSR